MTRVTAWLVVLALAVVVGTAVAPAGARAARDRPRVVLLTDSVGADASVWQLTVAGMRDAARTYRIDAAVVTPATRETYWSVATRLAREGADLVIGGLAIQGPDLIDAARTSPRTAFAILDVVPAETPIQWPSNARGFAFREQEIGYLVGYLAGLVEHSRPGPDVLAVIGGMRLPPVDRFIAGFRAGARRARPGIRVLLAYAGTFTDPERCARIATAQIERGAGVVFPVAGWCGNGALAVTRRRHVWGIGVDSDQAGLGPHILTSAVKRFDLAVGAAVSRLVSGAKPYGGTTSLGLRDGALALGRVSARVPRAFVSRTLALAREIAAGKVAIPTTVS
jgi:basic membrane protein A